MTECTFCSKISGLNLCDPWDMRLFSSRRFVAMPSRGSLVPGWMLVATKSHLLSMGSLDASCFDELDSFVELVSNAVQDCFGQVSLFEHGAVSERQTVGCGVDHAHLHIVPTSFDLAFRLSEDFPGEIHWQQVDGIRDAKRVASEGLAYLYFESPEKGAVLATNQNFGSQMFRRALASCMGRPDKYDWRTYPETENVIATVSALTQWIDNSSCEVSSPMEYAHAE